MKKKKNQWSGPLAFVVIVFVMVGLVRHFHIKNFHIIEPGVLYTSGQPKGMDYARLLHKYHIATIVNVRSEAEHRERNWYNYEIIWVKENGVKYKELAIDRSIHREKYFPSKPQQQEFLNTMADKTNLPVLLHGSSGRKRVAMVTAVWLIAARNYSIEETIQTVEKIKTEPVTQPEKEFIEGLLAEKPSFN